ncbi:MAG: serine O-acetyltransferase EpsC [Acidobacteriota bacterium]
MDGRSLVAVPLLPAPAAATRRLFRVLRDDAVELARAARGNATLKSVAATVVANDAFAILALCRLRALARRFHVIGVNHLLRRIQTVIYGIEIGNEVTLGRGVYFIHPIGVVVGGNAQIGDRVRFLGSNTVGTACDNGYPVVEDDVVLGAGSRILGPIRVGARSVVGANAVVVRTVPSDCVATGIPASARPRRADKARS